MPLIKKYPITSCSADYSDDSKKINQVTVTVYIVLKNVSAIQFCSLTKQVTASQRGLHFNQQPMLRLICCGTMLPNALTT